MKALGSLKAALMELSDKTILSAPLFTCQFRLNDMLDAPSNEHGLEPAADLAGVYRDYQTHMAERNVRVDQCVPVLGYEEFKECWERLDRKAQFHAAARFSRSYKELLEEERRQLAGAIKELTQVKPDAIL